MEMADFMDGARRSAQTFDAWINDRKPDARADHLCFKCASSDEYEMMRRMFESDGAFVYQSIITKRRIAIIGLRTAVPTLLGEIRVLELSDQKPDGSQTSGFDHIEIFPTNGSVEDLLHRLESSGALFERIERPHHTTYDTEIGGGFKVRLEEEPLIEKIKREEFR